MPLPLAVQVLTMALALLCFNIAGVYITKLQSATHRACVDATRQAVVWMHALLVGWEEFSLVERDVESTARCGRPARPNRLIGRGSGQPHTRRCWPISSQSSGAAGGRLRRAS